MEVCQTYKDDGTSRVISLKDCITLTEGCGWWKRGVVEQMLKDGQSVFTPTATFELIKN